MSNNKAYRPIQYLRNFLTLIFVGIVAYLFTTGLSSCDFASLDKPPEDWDTLFVTASAYNSLRYQTAGDPNVGAWGDTLAPGMKVIAVSRDLQRKGLDYNTPVKIEGMEGIYLVKDRMHFRWKNKIDIYMGEDLQKAKKWGRKRLKIYYLVEPEEAEVPEENL